MARISTNYQAVLRAYTESSRVNAIPMEAEALFIRLLCLSDGQGAYHGDPFIVCARALTHRMRNGVTPDDVAGWLDDMEGAGLIQRYEFSGDSYLLINRYHDAGNKSRALYPPPPFTGDEPPPAGDEAPPAKKKRPRKKRAAAKTGDSRARGIQHSTPTTTTTPTATPADAGADAEPPVKDRGESVENPSEDGEKLRLGAQRLAFEYFVPQGLSPADIPEVVSGLAGERWLGSYPIHTVEAAARNLHMRVRGMTNPGALILKAIQEESASQNGLASTEAPATALASPVLDASSQNGSEGSGALEGDTGDPGESEGRAQKASHHERYAQQLMGDASSIEGSRPEEAAALRDTAERHLAAAKRLLA